jgi:hypothetical protein
MRSLIQYKREILNQETALDRQRRTVADQYHGLKEHYYRQLCSPPGLLASFATGLLIGTLILRPRRRTNSGASFARRRAAAWLKLVRTVGGPALIQYLRRKAAERAGVSRI